MMLHKLRASSQDWTEKDPELRPVGIAIVGAGYWGKNLVRNRNAVARHPAKRGVRRGCLARQLARALVQRRRCRR